MAKTFNYGAGIWATKTGSSMAYNDQNNNYKPTPFSVTRDSIATRVNKQGLIEVVGKDKLRIDYTDSTKGVALLEPARTNNVTYSEDFTQWTNTGSETTDTAASATSPDGSSNATKLQEANSSFGYHRLSQSITGSSGTNYSLSVFAKKGTLNYFQLLLLDTGTSVSLSKVFDLENGILGETIINGSATLQDAKIEDYGNGWYRCTIIGNIIATPNTFRINLANAATGNTTNLGMVQYTGDSNGNIYIWGAQLEQGSYATSYIPTSGSTYQRQSDVANGAGNSEVFNDSEGVLFADIAALHNTGDDRWIAISDGGYSNQIKFAFSDEANKIRIYATGSSTIDQEFTISDNKLYKKIALSYSDTSDELNLYVNGFVIYTTTSIPNFSGLDVIAFDNGAGVADFYGKAKEIGVYDAVLTDAELEALTSYTSFTNMANELNLTIK